MSTAERKAKWLLKVLSGPNLGAEVALVPGEYTLGRGGASDVVLADSSIAPVHLHLVVTEKRVSVFTQQGQLALLDGEELPEGEEGVIEEPATLTLGTTHIGLGSSDTEWTGLVLPESVLRSRQQAAEAQSAQPQPAAEPVAGADQEDLQRKPGRRDAGARITTGLLSLGLAGLAAWCTLDALQTDAENKADEQARAGVSAGQERAVLQAALDKLELQGLEIVADRRNRLQVQGYLATREERERLDRKLRELPFRVGNRTYSQDRIMEALNATLASLGYSQLQTDYQGSGVVALRGYLNDEQRQQQLRDLVKQDVAGLVEVRDQIDTQRDRQQALRGWLAEKSLDGTVRVDAMPGLLKVSGELSDEQMAAWNQVQQTYRDRYGDQPPLQLALRSPSRDEVTFVPPAVVEAAAAAGGEKLVYRDRPAAQAQPTSSYIDLAVTGVMVGQNMSVLVLQDGRNLREGMQVSDRLYVKKIAMDHILLSDGQQDFKYSVRGS